MGDIFGPVCKALFILVIPVLVIPFVASTYFGDNRNTAEDV